MTAPMPETMSPREKVVHKQPCDHCQRMTVVDPAPILAALASSGDHAELADQAKRDIEWSFLTTVRPSVLLEILAENAALRGERDALIAVDEAGETLRQAQRDSTHTAEAELDAVSSAIGTVRFMDPPDGGDVPLSEQVRRMASALSEAERKLAEAVADKDAAFERLDTEINQHSDTMERLAEAVGLLRQALGDMDRRVITAETANRIDYFLSKEAER